MMQSELMVEIKDINPNPRTKKMNLGTKSCLKQCKVDTGADCNLLAICAYKCLGGNVCELVNL